MDRTAFTLDGAGNRFVALDWRGEKPLTLEDASNLARRLCGNGRDRVADGLLMLEDPLGPRAHFRMRYLNSDGSPAAFCGNGARCIALLARSLGAAPEAMTFESQTGPVAAEIAGDRVRVRFPSHGSTPLLDRPTGFDTECVDSIVTGVPHVVRWVPNVQEFDVQSEGQRLRHLPWLGRSGANVTFASVGGAAVVRIRTYERGVEAETPACGTGAVAAAACYAARIGRNGRLALDVIPTSGAELTVTLTIDGKGVSDVVLDGPAKIVSSYLIPDPVAEVAAVG